MSRQRYLVRLEASTPLLIGAFPAQGNYRSAMLTLPGRTWRGALAATLFKLDRERFNALFGIQPEDQIHFGALLPSSDAALPVILPTVQTCKRYPGYLRERPDDENEASEDDPHGIFDTAARQFALEAALKASPLSAFLDEMRCPVCGEPGDRCTELPIMPQRQSSTHVAINRRRHVAQEGQLYVREGINTQPQNLHYTGYVDIPENLVAPFEAVLQAYGATLSGVGANRSRGMGNMRFGSWQDDAAQFLHPAGESPAEIEQRVGKFNENLEICLNFYRWQTGVEYDELAHARAQHYVTLDLHSPMMLPPGTLAYAADSTLPLELIAPELADGGGKIVRAWLRPERITGWHSAARLPRHTQYGTVGTLLLQFEQPPDFNRLTGITTGGIGSLCEQGFGQITVCHPVHEITRFLPEQ